MAVGFRVNTADGYMQIDDNYSNCCLNRVVKLSDLPYDETYGFYTLYLDDDEHMVAVYAPNNEAVVEEIFYHYDDNVKRYEIPRGNAENVLLYIFGEKRQSGNTSGLQVFNNNGECVFDSNYKYMTIAYFGTNYDSKILAAGKKYAVCTFGYNMNIVQNTSPAGVAYSWRMPTIQGNTLTVETIRTQNGHILTSWQPSQVWLSINLFSYFLVDVTNIA